MRDRIVYIVTSNPGGIDGMDHTDKGGKLLWASFDKAEMEKKIGKATSWYTLTPTVIDTDTAKNASLAKLNPLDRLILGL